MDDSENVDRLIFFEQYLIKLKSEHTEHYHEIVERILSKQLDIPFVEECRKLFTKQKKLKKNGKVFGSSLQNYQLARIQPLVITIRDQIESEGIFRKPGSRQRQRDLRDQLDKGDALPSVINVNDAADLLKAFLRELPNPLLPSEHFGTHISIADMKTCEGAEDKRRKIMTLQALLLCLPDVNRRCLRLVLSLLYSVARAQDENKMTATSLATVFLPALLPQVIETGSDPSDRGKMNDHVCFLIRHSRKILMPPVEIVHLVHKFYPECVKNMPPVVKVTGKRKIQTRAQRISEMKDSILNFISPKKKVQARKKNTSVSHTLLFRSGSADWTSSPRALDRESRSKSEKVLNRKSRLLDNDNRDTLSDDVVLNDEFEKFGQLKKSHDIGSISSGLSSGKSSDTLNTLDHFPSYKPQSCENIPDRDPVQCPASTSTPVMKKGASGSSIYKDFGRNDIDTARFDQCLDESTLDEPELQIRSVGDLLRIRQKEAIAESIKEKEAEKLRKATEVNDKLSESEIIQTYGSTTHSPIPVKLPQIVDSKETPTKSSKDDEKENRESVYDNMVSSTSSGSLKRHSPTPPKIDNHSKRKKTYHKEIQMDGGLSPSVIVKMRGPKPPLKPKPKFSSETKTRQSRRERIKRNSSTRMGPLAPLAISRKVKETII